MTDFNSIINGITQATQFVGAVNGAVNVLAPALQGVEASINNMAGSFNNPNQGYRPDMYGAPPNGYYGGVPSTMPMPQTYPSSSTDSSSIMGTVGNAIGGAAIGAMLSTKLINKPAIGPDDIGTEALKIKIPAGAKSIGMSALKAGGIGAAVGAAFSSVENMMKLSKNEITGGEATGNIVADTSVGFFTGMGGLGAGAGGSLLMKAAGFSAGSIPMAIGAAAAGLIGAVGVDMLLKKTGIRQSISDGIRNLVGG